MLITLFLRYLLKYPVALITLLVLEVCQIAGTLLLPSLNASVVDDGVAQGDVALVWRLGGIMLIVAVVQITASIGAIAAGAYASMSAARDMRSDIFRAVMTFGHREINVFGTSSLITRSTNDVRQVQQFLTMAMSMMIMAPLMAIGGLGLALLQDVTLSWVIIVTVCVLAAVMWVIVRQMVPGFRAIQERLDALGSVLSQQLSGLRVIRAFVKEETEKERFALRNADMKRTQLIVGRYFVALFPTVMLLVNLGTVVVVWFGAQLVAAGATQVGVVMAFIQYLMLILMGIMMFSFIAMMLPRAEVAAGRVLAVLNQEVALDRSVGTVTELPSPGEISFDSVTFCYPGAEAPVVSDATFTIRAGATVAIIGATGSGKTSILHLLLRLLDPTSGTVKVGGVDIRDIAAETLHQQFGYVPQKPHVFGRSIAENLRVGNPEANAARLWWALDVAQARSFVQAYSDGLDHVLMQGGTNLSGGQRQRISIAMAVVREAPIMVFDDSFSALDTATDHAVRTNLARDVAATKVIVTQRVSAARSADTILVMDNGAIVAQGTHAELLASSSVYREIVQSQGVYA